MARPIHAGQKRLHKICCDSPFKDMLFVLKNDVEYVCRVLAWKVVGAGMQYTQQADSRQLLTMNNTNNTHIHTYSEIGMPICAPYYSTSKFGSVHGENSLKILFI